MRLFGSRSLPGQCVLAGMGSGDVRFARPPGGETMHQAAYSATSLLQEVRQGATPHEGAQALPLPSDTSLASRFNAQLVGSTRCWCHHRPLLLLPPAATRRSVPKTSRLAISRPSLQGIHS